MAFRYHEEFDAEDYAAEINHPGCIEPRNDGLRPLDYYPLTTRDGTLRRELITSILTGDPEFYHRFVVEHVYQSEASLTIPEAEFDPTQHYLVSVDGDEEGMVNVVAHEWADGWVWNWQDFDFLPRSFLDGKTSSIPLHREKSPESSREKLTSLERWWMLMTFADHKAIASINHPDEMIKVPSTTTSLVLNEKFIYSVGNEELTIIRRDEKNSEWKTFSFNEDAEFCKIMTDGFYLYIHRIIDRSSREEHLLLHKRRRLSLQEHIVRVHSLKGEHLATITVMGELILAHQKHFLTLSRDMELREYVISSIGES